MRATGGNRFIAADADRGALLAAIDRGLAELEAWVADDPHQTFDPGAITVDTLRTANGRISVSVTGDFINTAQPTEADAPDPWPDAASWRPESPPIGERMPIPGYNRDVDPSWDSAQAQNDYVCGRLPWQRASSPNPSACVTCSRERTPHGPCDGGPCGCLACNSTDTTGAGA